MLEMLAMSDLSLMVKAGVQWGLFGGAVENLGTERHHEAYVNKIINLELRGCFAMTETKPSSTPLRREDVKAPLRRERGAYVSSRAHATDSEPGRTLRVFRRNGSGGSKNSNCSALEAFAAVGLTCAQYSRQLRVCPCAASAQPEPGVATGRAAMARCTVSAVGPSASAQVSDFCGAIPGGFQPQSATTRPATISTAINRCTLQA